MTSLLKIISLNVRGLPNQTKRRGIFSYLTNQKATLYCLQETFSQERMRISGLRNREDKLYLLMGQNTQGEYVSF